MKTALVLEGGAMRGLYTAGVLDYFMDKGISFDGVIGVSAGALFGVNLLSGQRGRVIRYNKKYNSDKNYMGVRPLLKSGNILDPEYVFRRVPRKLDPFDDEAFMRSGIPFYAVTTDLETGQACYTRIRSVFRQMNVLRASGSMPFVSRPVRVRGRLCLDGAVADSIPYAYMLDQGYDRVVVVMTKDRSFERKPIRGLAADAWYRRKYPAFAEALKRRHIMYQDQVDGLSRLEAMGIATVIRPSRRVVMSRMEKEAARMEEIYRLGIRDAAEIFPD